MLASPLGATAQLAVGVTGVEVWKLDLEVPIAVRDLVALALDAAPTELVIERRCGRCGSTDHGKPRLGGEHRGAIEWSLSRAGSVGLLALSRRGTVGVDIERLRPIEAPVRKAAQLLDHDDAQAVAAASAAERSALLLRRWTRVEAVLKAEGVGVAGLAAAATMRGSWSVLDLAAPPGTVAALAVRP